MKRIILPVIISVIAALLLLTLYVLLPLPFAKAMALPFSAIFDTTGFMPRAKCGIWSSGMIMLHNISDFLIWTAYLTIPFILLKFTFKRKDEIPFKHLFWLFGLFIVACGTTHFLDIVMFYEPMYRLSGIAKAVTALASWGTVIALFKVIPVALNMKSPETMQLEINERIKAEEELKNARESLEIRVKERTEELEKANESLKKEMAERHKAARQIEASLKEKEILLKEVHHRVKNNLQVISSMLNLQSNYIQDGTARTVFKDSQNRVRSMALVHEKLYQTVNLSQIDLEEYIRDFTRILKDSYNAQRVNIETNIGNVALSVDTTITLGLIINELISNSLKHAFKDINEPVIFIEIKKQGQKHILIVKDNGAGFPEDIDFRKTSSLGLQLIIMLTKQLEGTVEMTRNNGTEFIIIFNGK